MGFHNTSDNPKEYRDDAEVAAERERDPIERLRRFATGAGFWSGDRETNELARIREQIDETQRFIDAAARPTANAVFEHVYEDAPARFEEQRVEALELEREQGGRPGPGESTE
jgi:TPP-dependent pyruvate/acetoin dehydrogenase alpha subunit